MKVGIDSIHYYVPKYFLPIQALADARGIAYEKLNKGLGLVAMAIPDTNEDVATMAAEAVIRLIHNNKLNPTEIGRLYLGTESALDAAKPTATYAAAMVEKNMEPTYGLRALKNCDMVDMTFACIGAIDALENAMDWVRCNPNRKAIVVAADVAKYELASTGEYTQGAGAVAVLITQNPRLLAFNQHIGVATESVHDFFKPRRTFNKVNLLQDAAQLLGASLNIDDAENLLGSSTHPFWGGLNQKIEVHKEEPVFDGPYSNDCYKLRISEALENFTQKQPINVLARWSKLVFHLPYAFQGRRMIVENWINWMHQAGKSDELSQTLQALGLQNPDEDAQVKAFSKSVLYNQFVEDYIAQGEKASAQIGNMYTASIFMSMLSMLLQAAAADENLVNKKIGMFAYGSGSKSKVLEAEVQLGWKEALSNIALFEDLNNRQAIDFKQYENWHNYAQKNAFDISEKRRLEKIGQEGSTTGYRYYS